MIKSVNFTEDTKFIDLGSGKAFFFQLKFRSVPLKPNKMFLLHK